MVEHSALVDGEYACTLLERYNHLIGLFCRWKIWEILSTKLQGRDQMKTSPSIKRFNLALSAVLAAILCLGRLLAPLHRDELQGAGI